MAHFSKLDENGHVLTVMYIDNDLILDENGDESEAIGQAHFEKHHKWPANLWKKTSLYTSAGTHTKGETPFRKNFGGTGMMYDAVNDCFKQIQSPYPSWVFDETMGVYQPPVAEPTDGREYHWNESTQSWDQISTW
tara:strand:+ start:381 stop:788 length:408 start_codon:yes stop_codon:yes gene_type:complete